MPKIQLTAYQVIEYIILGINNGNYQAAKNLAQDYIDAMDKQEEIDAAQKEEGKKP